MAQSSDSGATSNTMLNGDCGYEKSPADILYATAAKFGTDVFSENFAMELDRHDKLASFRQKFCFPHNKDILQVNEEFVDLEAECIYMCGHSLGLKPKSADTFMSQSLEDWGKRAILSHFEGHLPAAVCDLPGRKYTAKLVGAREEEIALMNGLTVNLHLLMISFYKPTAERHKILMEEMAFPSDRYAGKSQIRFHGFDPKESLIYASPRKGEYILRTEDILDIIEKEGDQIALVLFSGVQYFTGQKFDIPRITEAGHKKGCIVGFDIAHGIGNVMLHLHEWNVDFACWCSYKYLNSGAGGVGGIFVHEKHNHSSLPKFHGWWSNAPKTRFLMKEDADIITGAGGLRLSNPPPWLMCLNLASLEIIEAATLSTMVEKQFLLTGYMELLLRHYFENSSPQALNIITPKNPSQRGCQLSLVLRDQVAAVKEELERRGALCDVRHHDKENRMILRVAPVPLYNSYHDVYRFINILREILK